MYSISIVEDYPVRRKEKHVPEVSPRHLLASLMLLIVRNLIEPVDGSDSSRYVPTDNIALDCGATTNYNTPYRSWVTDRSLAYSPIETATSSTFEANQLSSYLRITPAYSTARLSRSAFTYSFKVQAGPKFIRLYFYPADYSNFSRLDALFSVKSGNFTLLRDFSAALVADSLKVDGFNREFSVIVGHNQRLNLTFTPSAGYPNSYAFINAIEVVSMPEDLYFKSKIDTKDQGIQYIGQHNTYRREAILALETIERINVGGYLISQAEDTGMYRRWNPDNDYITSYNGAIPVNLTIQLKFTKIPNYTAPDAVYLTARTLGNNKTKNYSYNLTWSFTVDSGFHYLVRLHFCEFQIEIVEKWDRTFKIYIDKQLAESYASIIAWSGGNGIPIYRDYVVPIHDPGKKKNLSIAVHPNPELFTTYSDAIANGIEIFKIGNFDNSLAGPNPDQVSTAPPPPPVASSKSGTSVNKKVAIAIGTICSLLTVSVLCFLIYKRRKGHTKWASSNGSAKTSGSYLPTDLCRCFSLTEIKAATNNFDEGLTIGVGGFGKVYKGYINDGSTPVAIKRQNPGSRQGATEFMTEIKMLSQLRHVHLVSLIGYCYDGCEMILVYNYMARGTLCEHLYNTNNPPLPWKQRLQICIGAGRGLHYLHTGLNHTIIHRDVKTTNILLDEKWVPKVSDFGLSKLAPTTSSKTHISTIVKGTFGYLDPEYYRRQQLTEKSDVFSFGVVLFEVLCGRPAVHTGMDKSKINLASWAKRCYKVGTINQIIDPCLTGQISPNCLTRYCEIALGCLDDQGIKRPLMNEVVQGLEFALQLQEAAEAEQDEKLVGATMTINLENRNIDVENPTKGTCINSNDERFSGSCVESIKVTCSLGNKSDDDSISYDPENFLSEDMLSDLINTKEMSKEKSSWRV